MLADDMAHAAALCPLQEKQPTWPARGVRDQNGPAFGRLIAFTTPIRTPLATSWCCMQQLVHSLGHVYVMSCHMHSKKKGWSQMIR